jgi:hypothetical protein
MEKRKSWTVKVELQTEAKVKRLHDFIYGKLGRNVCANSSHTDPLVIAYDDESPWHTDEGQVTIEEHVVELRVCKNELCYNPRRLFIVRRPNQVFCEDACRNRNNSLKYKRKIRNGKNAQAVRLDTEVSF